LFNSYSIEEFKKWKEEMSGASGIQLKSKRTIRKVLYADDQVLKISKLESLQMVAHRLNIITKKYNCWILPKKIHGMCGNDTRRLKIVEESLNKSQNLTM
jgi:hypothetical protein